MKKTLIISALLAGSVGAFAQGTVNFTDHAAAFIIHIYAPQTDTPTVEVTGNGANDKPAGATVYNGGLVGGSATGAGLGNGNNIDVQLYAAPGAGVAESSLTPVSQYLTTVSTTTAGTFVANNPATDPGIPGTSGGTATVALAAWFNGGGLYPTLAQAQAAQVQWGMSDAQTLSGLGGTGSPPATAPVLDVHSFSLTQSVPEPSTIALGVMGASAFLLRRRMSK